MLLMMPAARSGIIVFIAKVATISAAPKAYDFYVHEVPLPPKSLGRCRSQATLQ
jgi:hypothetical protein